MFIALVQHPLLFPPLSCKHSTLGLGLCPHSPRAGEAPSRPPAPGSCHGCTLTGFSLSLPVENTTHCEFAYLRDLLIRLVGLRRVPIALVSSWHPKGRAHPTRCSPALLCSSIPPCFPPSPRWGGPVPRDVAAGGFWTQLPITAFASLLHPTDVPLARGISGDKAGERAGKQRLR